jgi:hypothetical protein
MCIATSNNNSPSFATVVTPLSLASVSSKNSSNPTNANSFPVVSSNNINAANTSTPPLSSASYSNPANVSTGNFAPLEGAPHFTAALASLYKSNNSSQVTNAAVNPTSSSNTTFVASPTPIMTVADDAMDVDEDDDDVEMDLDENMYDCEYEHEHDVEMDTDEVMCECDCDADSTYDGRNDVEMSEPEEVDEMWEDL